MTSLHNIIRDKIVEQIRSKGDNVDTEVINSMGRADIVSRYDVIEVCSLTEYKEGFGRVLAYSKSSEFSGKKPRLHLFALDNGFNQITLVNFYDIIEKALILCTGENVKLTFGNEKFHCVILE